MEKGSLLSEAYFTGFGAKNQFTKIIPYFILFLLLQLTHSHWNFENPWSLQGSEAKRRFCLHLGQASTSRPAGTIICLGDKICGSSNIVWWAGAVLDKINILAYNHLCYMSGLCFTSIFQQRSTTYLPRELSKFKVWKLVKEWIMGCTIQSCLFPTCHSKVYHQTGLQKHSSNNLSNLQLS